MFGRLLRSRTLRLLSPLERSFFERYVHLEIAPYRSQVQALLSRVLRRSTGRKGRTIHYLWLDRRCERPAFPIDDYCVAGIVYRGDARDELFELAASAGSVYGLFGSCDIRESRDWQIDERTEVFAYDFVDRETGAVTDEQCAVFQDVWPKTLDFPSGGLALPPTSAETAARLEWRLRHPIPKDLMNILAAVPLARWDTWTFHGLLAPRGSFWENDYFVVASSFNWNAMLCYVEGRISDGLVLIDQLEDEVRLLGKDFYPAMRDFFDYCLPLGYLSPPGEFVQR